jgi:hypothetical protein
LFVHKKRNSFSKDVYKRLHLFSKDVNDEAPTFRSDEYIGEVLENAPKATPVQVPILGFSV